MNIWSAKIKIKNVCFWLTKLCIRAKNRCFHGKPYENIYCWLLNAIEISWLPQRSIICSSQVCDCFLLTSNCSSSVFFKQWKFFFMINQREQEQQQPHPISMKWIYKQHSILDRDHRPCFLRAVQKWIFTRSWKIIIRIILWWKTKWKWKKILAIAKRNAVNETIERK